MCVVCASNLPLLKTNLSSNVLVCCFNFSANSFLLCYEIFYFSIFQERVGALSWRLLLKTACVCAPFAYCTSQSCAHPQSVISSQLSRGRRTGWQMGGALESQSPSLRSIRLWSGTSAVERTADTYKSIRFKASFHHETAQLLWDSMQYVDIRHPCYKLKGIGNSERHEGAVRWYVTQATNIVDLLPNLVEYH